MGKPIKPGERINVVVSLFTPKNLSPTFLSAYTDNRHMRQYILYICSVYVIFTFHFSYHNSVSGTYVSCPVEHACKYKFLM